MLTLRGIVERIVAAAVGAAAVALLGWSAFGAPNARAAVERGSATTPADTIHATITSVTDADASDGRWFVLDTRAGRIHVLDTAGGLVSTFGRKGSGPGELARPAALAVHRDTVAVVEAIGGVVHLYRLDGTFVSDRRIADPTCPGMADDIASTAGGLAVLYFCAGTQSGMRAVAVLESTDGAPLTTIPLTDAEPGAPIHPFFLPVFAPYLDGIVGGVVTDACLTTFDLGGQPTGAVCHDWITRIPPSPEVQESVQALREQARGRGMRVADVDFMPGFDGLFVLGDGRVVYRSLVQTSPDPYRAVTLAEAGEELRIEAPPAEHLYVSDQGLLLAWDELEGTRIRVVPRTW